MTAAESTVATKRKRKPATAGSWKPGQSGNPGGRRKTLRSAIVALAHERGDFERLSAAVLQALDTGVLPFRAVDVGLGHSEGYVEITSVKEWLDLVRYVWPAPKEADTRDDGEARVGTFPAWLRALAEEARTGTDG